MKSLLTVVADGPTGSVLETAVLVARQFNGHITGMHSLGSEYADIFGSGPGSLAASDLDRARKREGHARRGQAELSFRKFMNARGVPFGAVPARHDRPRASWLEEDSEQRAAVGRTGRAYDLIVVQQPSRLSSIAGLTFEDALYESDRPVLVVPAADPRVLGEVIAIAWNGSAETARTIALGMPFLKQAKRVVVVTVASQQMPDPGPLGQELAEALRSHGMNVSLRMAVGRRKPLGESFLVEAVAAGADLLLKGAYARSRIRQMIFGGATRHIILASTIPVLIAR